MSQLLCVEAVCFAMQDDVQDDVQEGWGSRRHREDVGNVHPHPLSHCGDRSKE